MYHRYLFSQIKSKLFQGRSIIVIGPRQVGKTTILKKILDEFPETDKAYYTGEDLDTKMRFSNHSLSFLKTEIGNKKIVVIDEAQYIENIGVTIKLITDNITTVQLLISGSSAFELNSNIVEPMTGRAYFFEMYPMTIEEMAEEKNLENFQMESIMRDSLIYGSYPSVVNLGKIDKRKELQLLRTQYLFKDALSYNTVKKSNLIETLTKALAHQVGSEVSYTGLADLLKVDNETIQKYIGLLEQSFIIFRQYPLNRFPRKELGISKTRKVYFYDNGILNIMKENFSELDLREDRGALWENFLMSERKKRNSKIEATPYTYFWRDYSHNEVDYIEETDGIFHAYEFKANNLSPKLNSAFALSYPKNDYKVVNFTNWKDFIL